MRKNKNKYLTRFDFKGTHGWQVRVPKNFNIDPLDYHSKLFSDGIYGSKRKSKKAALDYREAFLKKTHQLDLLLSPRRITTRSRWRDAKNTSGILGVRRAVDLKVTSSGNICVQEYWMGYGMIAKKYWSKTFSVYKYGEKEAFKWACQERYKRHGPLSVMANLNKFPCRIPVNYIKRKI